MVVKNVYFGKTSQTFLKALKQGVEEYKDEHPVLQDVFVGFKRPPVGIASPAKQVIIQTYSSEDGEQSFQRWVIFAISVYAPDLSTVEDLAYTLEGLMSVLHGYNGIRYAEVIVSTSEIENPLTTMVKNQSDLEDWRLFSVEVQFAPQAFTSKKV